MMPHALDLPKSLDQTALINRHVPLITQEGRPLLIAVEHPNRLIPFRRPKFIARVPIGKEIRVENQNDARNEVLWTKSDRANENWISGGRPSSTSTRPDFSSAKTGQIGASRRKKRA